MIQESIFFFSASNIPTKQSQYRSRSRLLDHQSGYDKYTMTVSLNTALAVDYLIIACKNKTLIYNDVSQYRSRSRLLDQV